MADRETLDEAIARVRDMRVNHDLDLLNAMADVVDAHRAELDDDVLNGVHATAALLFDIVTSLEDGDEADEEPDGDLDGVTDEREFDGIDVDGDKAASEPAEGVETEPEHSGADEGGSGAPAASETPDSETSDENGSEEAEVSGDSGYEQVPAGELDEDTRDFMMGVAPKDDAE